jgi:hypothetical protein
MYFICFLHFFFGLQDIFYFLLHLISENDLFNLLCIHKFYQFFIARN